jgi:hypothetical protein
VEVCLQLPCHAAIRACALAPSLPGRGVSVAVSWCHSARSLAASHDGLELLRASLSNAAAAAAAAASGRARARCRFRRAEAVPVVAKAWGVELVLVQNLARDVPARRGVALELCTGHEGGPEYLKKRHSHFWANFEEGAWVSALSQACRSACSCAPCGAACDVRLSPVPLRTLPEGGLATSIGTWAKPTAVRRATDA